MFFKLTAIKVAVAIFATLIMSCSNGRSDSAKIDAPKPTVFKVGILTWVGYSPIYLAKEKGFFENIDVDLQLVEDTSARRAALASGDIDASVDIVSSFANLLASGLNASAVLKLDDSTGGDGIVVKKEIQTIANLKGKTVAFPQGQPSHFFLIALLEKAGLSISDIDVRYMEPDQAGSAFISGSVDAAVTWEPWLTRAAESNHGKILATTKDEPGLIVDIFTVRNDFLAEKPDVVSAFLRGWFQAVDYWRENPKESNLIMSRAMRIQKVEEFESMARGVSYSDFDNNLRFFRKNEDGQSKFTTLLAKAGKVWLDEGLVKTEIDPMAADKSELLFQLKP